MYASGSICSSKHLPLISVAAPHLASLEHHGLHFAPLKPIPDTHVSTELLAWLPQGQRGHSVRKLSPRLDFGFAQLFRLLDMKMAAPALRISRVLCAAGSFTLSRMAGRGTVQHRHPEKHPEKLYFFCLFVIVFVLCF